MEINEIPALNKALETTVIIGAADLEDALGVTTERAEELSKQVMDIVNKVLGDSSEPTGAFLLAAGAKVATNINELLFLSCKTGIYMELSTNVGSQMLMEELKKKEQKDEH